MSDYEAQIHEAAVRLAAHLSAQVDAGTLDGAR